MVVAMTDDEHTLLIVEEADLDDPTVYQVTQLDHPPDSPQVAAVEDAMRKMVGVAEEETGTPHRFVKESDDPDVIASHYEMHTDAEDEELVTDGGTDQDDGDTDQIDAPWWCPWCEAVICIDGEIVTEESKAYWHAYDHRDKGPYAVTVMEAFEVLDTVETTQHKVEPVGGGSDEE